MPRLAFRALLGMTGPPCALVRGRLQWRTLLNLFQASGTSSVPAGTPGWVSSLIGVAGGWGLLLIAFVDSSFGTLPIVNDLLVIWLSVQDPSRWAFYAGMATVGSVLGCLVVFYLGRKGGDLLLRKKAKPQQVERMRRWYERNEFLTVAVPALMPPPTPFKLFVLAAGVFQVRLRYFLTALSLGRGVRYFTCGFLGAKFGDDAKTFLENNLLQVIGIAVALILAGYLLVRLAERFHRPRASAG